MCGILAGDGTASEGKYCGIAPKCRLVCAKVLDEKGSGSLRSLLEGLHWVLEMKQDLPIRIVNISIEMEPEAALDKQEVALLKKYLEVLWNSNVIVIAAAGNRGPAPMSISPIGEAGSCVCVGCHDGDYVGAGGRTCAEYSGRGPAKIGDAQYETGELNPLKKPDLVAPGTDIVSCSAKVIWKNRTWQHAYVAKSGTSMATPIVSGACALCMQKYPKITNKELYRKLMRTAKDMGERWSIQGAGMLQIQKLLETSFF